MNIVVEMKSLENKLGRKPTYEEREIFLEGVKAGVQAFAQIESQFREPLLR